MTQKTMIAVLASFGLVVAASSLAYRTLHRGQVALHAARRLQADGRYDRAAGQYNRALRAGIGGETIAGALIHLYHLTGNSGVLSALKQHARGENDGGAVLERIARAEYSMGDFVPSAGTYALALATDPGRTNLHVEHARSLFFAGRFDDSVRSYRIFLREKEVETDDNAH